MAIEYHMLARCDGCRCIIAQADVKKTDIDSTRWAWEREWEKTGVMKQERYMRAAKLFCQPCADGVPPPKPSPS